jgi:hypothetical protein
MSARVIISQPPATSFSGAQSTTVDFFNSITGTVHSSGTFDPIANGMLGGCFNILGNIALTIVTGSLTAGNRYRVLASGGVPSSIQADSGLIGGLTVYVLKPGQVITITWDGTQFVVS